MQCNLSLIYAARQSRKKEKMNFDLTWKSSGMQMQSCSYLMSQSQHSRVNPPQSQPPHTQGFRRCQPPSSQLQRMQIIWGSIFFMSTKIERIWISRDIKGPAQICAVPKIGLLDIVIWKNYFLNNLKKRSCEIFTVLRMARNSNPPFEPVNESKLIVVLIGKPINLCQV